MQLATCSSKLPVLHLARVTLSVLTSLALASAGSAGASIGSATRTPVAVAVAAPDSEQLPRFQIASGVSMPAVSCGHPDANCSHGLGPGCAAAAQKMTAMWLRLGGRGVDTVRALRRDVPAAERGALSS